MPQSVFNIELVMTPKFENKKISQGYNIVIGCDEVGRGCLAGPVVAAAVCLNLGFKIGNLKLVKDSKLLTPQKREELALIIKQNAWWGIGEADEKTIDKINIHNASLLAMRKAVENLLCHCEEFQYKRDDEAVLVKEQIAALPSLARNDKMFLYIDGKFKLPDFHMEQEAVVGGDNKILSVAAASIIAKVHRDSLMRKYHLKYPLYDFARHKGYATFHHRQIVKQYGLCSIHRLSFCRNLK